MLEPGLAGIGLEFASYVVLLILLISGGQLGITSISRSSHLIPPV